VRPRRLLVVPLILLAIGLSALPASAGPPGHWTKISTGKVSLINETGLYRTADGVLHVVYEREVGTISSIGHTAIKATGGTKLQNVAIGGWDSLVHDPKAVGLPGGGIRLVFGGIRDTSTMDFWIDGRTYTATGNAAGSSWNLPSEAIGLSHSGYGSYGTGATTLANGTPIASFPLNSTLTWHVGTGSDPDHVYTFGQCCLYDSTLARDGGKVYAAFYANGSTKATNGTFVKPIYPTAGPTKKVPGSSKGKNSLSPDQAVAMTARKGGGVFVAFCVGYPTCAHIGLWKIGSPAVHVVPNSGNADNIAISAAPNGRLWIAWNSSTTGRVYAVRTGPTGLTFGTVHALKLPGGVLTSVYHVAIEGSRGRGDVVINTGKGLYHQQVKP
jgi:hypothetical protein